MNDKYKPTFVNNNIQKNNFYISIPMFKGRHISELHVFFPGNHSPSFNIHKDDIYQFPDFEDKLKLKYEVLSQYIEKGWWCMSISSKDESVNTNNFYIELIDYILDMDKPLDNMIETVVNESVWGDLRKRSSGEVIRKEDDVLSDLEIKVANELTLMYCRNEIAKYIQNHMVPLPPSHRKENDYEGLIKYIEARRDEKFYNNNFDDYDTIIRYIKKNWDRLDMDKYVKRCIFSPDMMKGKKLLECEGVPGGATPANVGGMGAAYFPGPNGEPGSGDLPSPTGIVYHQVAPYTTFLKQIKKKKKKTKKFRKEDEPCVHSPNAKVYDYVDDFREYVDRTYNNMDRRR